MNQAEGADGGGGEEGVGWWRWRRRRSAMECSVNCVMAFCRRKPHWPTVLPVLGVGWLVATFLTGYGMYMVICHAPTHHLHVFTTRGYQTMIDRTSDVSTCGGSWTVGQGQATLILGCFLNGFILALMLFNMFLDRRLQHPIQIQEQPPDYETLIKEETPPPSYSEVFSSPPSPSSSSSSLSGVLFVSSSPTPSNHPLIIV